MSEKCDPKCPGWGVFSTGAGTMELQRCDDCDVFVNDMAAAAAALKAIATDPALLYCKEDIKIAIIGDLYMSFGYSRAEIQEIQNREGINDPTNHS
jgi:hypothetical protein